MIILHHPDEIEPVFINTLLSEDPIFINRIGGSDFEAVCQYYNDKTLIDNDEWVSHQSKRVKDLNGYFDFENKKETFKEYLETMISCYIESDIISYAGKISNQFARIKDKRSSDFKMQPSPLTNKMSNGKYCIHWNSFIEDSIPFLRSFKIWGRGKRILIVSPFEKSIIYQYNRKNNLFLNYEFPNFELVTYKTSITYSSNDDDKESLNIQTTNWIQEYKKMNDEISKLDFDIALLSCGSYAIPIGHFIRHSLNKKSIYIGGPLNLYFNIYGERYKDIFKTIGLNLDYQLEPFENEEIKSIQGGKNYHGESLKAYFGYKK